jgi:hypothetical protein
LPEADRDLESAHLGAVERVNSRIWASDTSLNFQGTAGARVDRGLGVADVDGEAVDDGVADVVGATVVVGVSVVVGGVVDAIATTSVVGGEVATVVVDFSFPPRFFTVVDVSRAAFFTRAVDESSDPPHAARKEIAKTIATKRLFMSEK